MMKYDEIWGNIMKYEKIWEPYIKIMKSDEIWLVHKYTKTAEHTYTNIKVKSTQLHNLKSTYQYKYTHIYKTQVY